MPINQQEQDNLEALLKRLLKTSEDDVVKNHAKGLLIRLTLPTG